MLLNCAWGGGDCPELGLNKSIVGVDKWGIVLYSSRMEDPIGNLRRSGYIQSMITGDLDDKTQDEIAVIFGVTPQTIYTWKKCADWPMIKAERRKLYAHQILKIDSAMLRAAEKGDTAAAKIMYERFDGWVPTTAIKNIEEKSDEALIQRAAEIKLQLLANAGDGPDIGGAG